MSDSSDDEVASVAPRSRKRRKLVPQPEDDLSIKSSSSSSTGLSSSASLTTLSSNFLRKTSAIDARPAIKKKKAGIESIPSPEEREKRLRNYQALISSSDDDDDNRENGDVKITGWKSSSPRPVKSPSPPPPPPDVIDPPEPSCCDSFTRRGKRGGRRKSNRKSTPASMGIKTSAKANKGLKAVQELRSLHDRIQYETRTQDFVMAMRENMTSPTRDGGGKDSDVMELKIRSPSGLHRIPARKSQPLTAVFAKMAEIERCEASHVVMTCDDREIRRSDTPDSLGLTIVNILECVVLKATASSQGTTDSEGGEGTIKLKIQSLDSKVGQFITIAVETDVPLSEMMNAAAKQMGVGDAAQLTFRFDGEVINPESTAGDYEMEDDDCVDVVQRK